MPPIVIVAVVNHSKPSMGPMRSFDATVVLFYQVIQILR